MQCNNPLVNVTWGYVSRHIHSNEAVLCTGRTGMTKEHTKLTNVFNVNRQFMLDYVKKRESNRRTQARFTLKKVRNGVPLL